MLTYRRTGEGKPLVILHSFVGGSGAYVPTMNHFRRHYDVVAADLPGFAGSAGEPLPDSIEGFGAAVLDLLDGLGIGRFHLMGHSLGGNIGLQMTLDVPDRIEHCVLYGSVACAEFPHRFETLEDTFARIEAEGIAATRERLVKSWFLDGERNPYYPMCRAAGEGVGAEAAVATLKMTQRWDVRERLRDIKVPVMLIGGDLDRNVGPQDLFDQWRAIEGARLAIVPGCAHNVHLEKPELFHRMVEDFLSEPPPG